MKYKLLITTIYLFSFMNIAAQFDLTGYKDSHTEKSIISLDALKDELIVINIWDPDMPQEVEILNQLVDKYKDKKVRFIAITDRVSSTVSAPVFNYQRLTGEEAEKLFNKYQTGMFKIYPIHIILNHEREVVFKKQRFIKNIDKKIIKKLDDLLSKIHDNSKSVNEIYTMK